MAERPIVIIESPYAGDTERNVRYARAAVRDSIRRGEAPFASHLLYTQPGILDDLLPSERGLGLQVAESFRGVASCTAAYLDLGISPGMERAFSICAANGMRVDRRWLRGWGPA